jgi:hypothetical protein
LIRAEVKVVVHYKGDVVVQGHGLAQLKFQLGWQKVNGNLYAEHIVGTSARRALGKYSIAEKYKKEK